MSFWQRVQQWFGAHHIEAPANGVEVLDGDTLRYKGTTFRVAQMDAPEHQQPFSTGEAGAGKIATNAAKRLLQDRGVRLTPLGKDVYGRTLADVWVQGQGDFAHIMIAYGFAGAGLTARAELHDAENTAMASYKGLWEKGGFTRPRIWRQSHPKRDHPIR